VAEQLGAGVDCRISPRVEGRPRRLAPMIENNLLRIGQEAVANALKHARARNIGIAISFAEPTVRLVIEDDGAGFEPAETAAPGEHFGLRGMRERVAQMSGRLTVGRGAQGGTRVEVVVDAVG
jgi:signal transduction histidine kinase